MIIVQFMGGLGNQMFQYALCEKLKSNGNVVKADIETGYKKDELRKYDIDIFQEIDIEKVDSNIYENYLKKAYKLKNRIIGKIFPYKKKIYNEKGMFFDSNIFRLRDAYIKGYWQSERYFLDIRNILLQKFKFPECRDEKNSQYLKQIKEGISVSIHVRRGDYLTETNRKIYGNICTIEYYQKAIKYFEEKYPEVCFFVFSNDVKWTKENLQMRHAVYVEGNSEENGYKDMYLMTQCKHNIIANSSFSWWGAWLNQNEEKEVVAPSKWLNTEEVKDIWCEGWKLI